jgi:hypothetical protein
LEAEYSGEIAYDGGVALVYFVLLVNGVELKKLLMSHSLPLTKVNMSLSTSFIRSVLVVTLFGSNHHLPAASPQDLTTATDLITKIATARVDAQLSVIPAAGQQRTRPGHLYCYVPDPSAVASPKAAGVARVPAAARAGTPRGAAALAAPVPAVPTAISVARMQSFTLGKGMVHPLGSAAAAAATIDDDKITAPSTVIVQFDTPPTAAFIKKFSEYMNLAIAEKRIFRGRGMALAYPVVESSEPRPFKSAITGANMLQYEVMIEVEEDFQEILDKANAHFAAERR